MEKQYDEKGRELVGKCLYCKEFIDDEGNIIDDYMDIMDIEDNLAQNIAIISHSVCASCLATLSEFQDLDNDDGLHFLTKQNE